MRNGRTVITILQKKILKEQYEKNKFPSKEDKLAIKRQTGLHIAVVNTWFQNKRARSKHSKSTVHTK